MDFLLQTPTITFIGVAACMLVFAVWLLTKTSSSKKPMVRASSPGEKGTVIFPI